MKKKTEVIFFDSNPSTSHNNTLGPLSANIHNHVKNLGVILDSNLKLDKQVGSVVRCGFFQLRIIAKVKPYLSTRDLERVTHAFIASRLDYCNSLYVGMDQSLLRRLQLVQNAAARLLTGTKKRQHITPVLASLHWLPVRFRIDFKILTFVYKARNNLAPPFIVDLIRDYTPNRALRSGDQLLLVTPTTSKRSRGDRAFAAAAPRLWNSLPLHIRASQSINIFKSLLKTHFFLLSF